METFNASCRPGEMLLVDAARYGRMKLGRCVTRSYGHLGCAADVRRILDARCSGRRACQFIVPDPTIYRMQPCPGDFTSYLQTTYSCVEGCIAQSSLHTVTTDSSFYASSRHYRWDRKHYVFGLSARLCVRVCVTRLPGWRLSRTACRPLLVLAYYNRPG